MILRRRAGRLQQVATLAAVAALPLAGPGPAAGQYSKLSTIDLVQTQVNAPARVKVGKTFLVSDTVENQGEAQAPRTVTGFCLAVDDTCDASDVKLAARRVPALDPGASHSFESPLKIPKTVAPGTYYLVVIANANNDVEERHRGNNTRALKVVVEGE